MKCRIIFPFILSLFSLAPTSSMAIYILNGSAQYGQNAEVKWSATMTKLETCTPFCDTNTMSSLTLDSFAWNYIPSWRTGMDITPLSHAPLLSLYDDNNDMMDGFQWSLWDEVYSSMKYPDNTVYEVYDRYNFENDKFRYYDEFSVRPTDFADALNFSTSIQISNVPEPTTILLIGAGLIVIGLRFNEKKRQVV